MRFKNHPIILGFTLFAVLTLTSSCSSYVQFPKQVALKPKMSNVQTIALNKVTVQFPAYKQYNDNRGNWRTSSKTMDVKGIRRLIKNAVSSTFAKHQNFQMVDLADAPLLVSNDFSELAPRAGYTFKGPDALLNLQVRIQKTRQDGISQSIKSLGRRVTRKVGKKWKTTTDRSRDQVVNEPYQSSHYSIVCQYEIIDVKNGNFVTLVNGTESFVISFVNGEHLPKFQQAFSGSWFESDDRSLEQKLSETPLYNLDHYTYAQLPGSDINLGHRIATILVAKITPGLGKTVILQSMEIDTDGDSESVALMEKGDLENAMKRIEKITMDNKEKTAPNLYNLGVCYEAIKEYGLALQKYRQANQLDPENETYIQGISNLENIHL